MRDYCVIDAEAGKGGAQVLAHLGNSPARTGCSVAQGDSPVSTSSRLSFRVEEGTPLQNGARERERALRRTADSEGAEAHGLQLNGSVGDIGSGEEGQQASGSGAAAEGHAVDSSSSGGGLRGKSSPPAAEDGSHELRASGSLRDSSGRLLLQRKGLAQRVASLPLPDPDGTQETERLVGDTPVRIHAWHMSTLRILRLKAGVQGMAWSAPGSMQEPCRRP